MAIEEPAYTVVDRVGDVEIRQYAPLLVAETAVEGDFDDAGSEAFRRLAGYIFGGNRARDAAEGSRKIAMTAPVAMRPAGTDMAGGTLPAARTRPAAEGRIWVMSFSMPRQWTLDTLPEPLDGRVTLREEPARRVAVLEFSGLWSDERFAAREAELRAALAGSEWQAIGAAESMRYDPPWKPWFLRRNEVQLPVEPAVLDRPSGGR